MTAKEQEEFAAAHDITTVDVEGSFGCGYPCAYVYFEPESVIACINALNKELESIKYPKAGCL